LISTLHVTYGTATRNFADAHECEACSIVSNRGLNMLFKVCVIHQLKPVYGFVASGTINALQHLWAPGRVKKTMTSMIEEKGKARHCRQELVEAQHATGVTKWWSFDVLFNL